MASEGGLGRRVQREKQVMPLLTGRAGDGGGGGAAVRVQFFLRCSQDRWPRCDEEARLNWSPSVSLADENPHRDEEGVVSDVGKCIVFLAAEGRSVTWERCSPGWGDLFLLERSYTGASTFNGGDIVTLVVSGVWASQLGEAVLLVPSSWRPGVLQNFV